MTAILASVLTFDLFIHPDRSSTFDGRVHITTIQMYHDLMAKRQFPVLWVDSWGNYGYPLGLISYQLSSYLGGGLEFVLKSPVLAYNAVIWIATFLSGVLMYLWLRKHVGVAAAIFGEVLFIFTPYHIQNVFVRGALPEYLGGVFILLTLLGISTVLINAKPYGHVLVIIGVALLVLSHPMMLVTGSVICSLYALIVVWQRRISFLKLITLGISSVLGLLLSSYYFLPLTLELKYFYYGLSASKLRLADAFLSIPQLLSASAPYLGSSAAGPPGVSLRLGLVEAGSILLAALGLLMGRLRQKKFMLIWLGVTLGLVALTLPISKPLFEHISVFNNLQYPWRFLSVISIAITLVAALLFDQFGNRWLLFLGVGVILCLAVPTAYGKNYILTPLSEYQFTVTNLHTKNMAPIWAGESADYPLHPEKVALIEGVGQITNLNIQNSVRSFDIQADGRVRMADYTFFFPGWKVYLDGVELPFEFQDMNYRGIITYIVPPGKHHVEVKFISTRDRKVGWLLTGVGALLSVGWIVCLLYKPCLKVFSRVKYIHGRLDRNHAT